VVNLLTAKAIQDGEAGIFGGQQWRPLVHVKDVAEAIALTLQAPFENASGQVLSVGCNEQNYQIADLGVIIFGFLKQKGDLQQILLENEGAWDWVKLSAADATMLSEVIMAVIEPGSPELMGRLRGALVQAILGDV
jgi:nucleoside-diphosphate-sugar epimerase